VKYGNQEVQQRIRRYGGFIAAAMIGFFAHVPCSFLVCSSAAPSTLGLGIILFQRLWLPPQ